MQCYHVTQTTAQLWLTNLLQGHIIFRFYGNISSRQNNNSLDDSTLDQFSHVMISQFSYHDGVVPSEHLAHYWSSVRGIHGSPVNSPHEGPVMQTFDGSNVVSLNKLLNKPPSYRWFETLERSCDVTVILQNKTVAWYLAQFCGNWWHGM